MEKEKRREITRWNSRSLAYQSLGCNRQIETVISYTDEEKEIHMRR